MKVETIGKKYHYTLESIEELIACASMPAGNNDNKDSLEREKERSTSGAEYWLGAENWNAALGYMRSGWLEGLIRLDEIEDEIRHGKTILVNPSSRRVKKKKFSSEGDELDMSKVYEGNFDTCWTGTQHVSSEGTGKFVKIYTNITFNCKTDSSTHFYTGVVCTILTDILEEAGYRVEIIGYSNVVEVYRNGMGVYIETTYKHPDMPLDKERICMATGLAAIQRICTFSLYYSRPETAYRSLGIPEDSPINSENAIVIQEINSKEACIKTINELLERFTKD